MKNSLKMALGFVALSAALSTAAHAEMGKGGNGGQMGFGGMAPFETLDGDKTGDISFEEFKKAAGERFVLADVNKDSKVTVEEMAAAIEKMRAQRMATRMIERLDTDKDGAVTQAEIEVGQKAIYARLDRNEDGKLVADELQRRGKGKHGGRHHNSNNDE